MRAFRPILAFALALALPLALAPKSDAGWPNSGRVYGGGGGGASVVAVSINFPSGSVGGVNCASLAACIADIRSSTATYINRSGGLSTAAVNTPRIDCTNGTCGLLNEGASTNLALYSANVGGTDWATADSGYAVPTVTPNAATAPDGAMTATQVAFPATTGASGNYSIVYSNGMSVSASTNYTLSTFFKGAAGGEKYYLSFAVNGSPYFGLAQSLVTLTTAFGRYAATGSSSSYTSLNVQIGFSSDGLTEVAQAASTSYSWGVQFEAGSFATSYIPTTSASASRAADSMSAAGPLASAMSAGQSYVDMIDEATGATSRTLYAAGAFNWPPYKWITQICAYSPSVGSGYLTAHSTYGTSC